MKVINSIFNFNSIQKTYVTIGTFDGVHLGHQKVIKKLVEDAKKDNSKSVLLTFFPHPRMVLQKDSSIKLINTIEEKTKLLEKTGLDYLIIHPFSKDFAELTALNFTKNILVEKLNISKLVIGYDHHFGKNREGNINQLTKYSHKFNFTVEEIKAQDINDVNISSTKIREALQNGNIKTANKYLGYNFSIFGKVVKGNQLGRSIGFPTANIKIEEEYKLIPKTGVYLVKSIIEDETVYGMMNIGNRPTVNGKHQTIEVFYFNFNENLYGKKLNIEFLHFIREEKKFSSINELTEQLKKDEETSKNIICNNLY
ncbi:MAG: bifunctional riboflavin kinase/FAD synthetase [Tenacibaculum sp.]|nr:bifunctional riboflavin kinase/FAD synthetase [Tenacibaculum sp.]